jgi:uncharacterized membrane protein YdfJ with MMPL/SSD domain
LVESQGLQMLRFGLAAATLIDVTIVRGLLLPSATALFSRWNRCLPTPAARLFRVEPSRRRSRAVEERPAIAAP